MTACHDIQARATTVRITISRVDNSRASIRDQKAQLKKTSKLSDAEMYGSDAIECHTDHHSKNHMNRAGQT